MFLLKKAVFVNHQGLLWAGCRVGVLLYSRGPSLGDVSSRMGLVFVFCFAGAGNGTQDFACARQALNHRTT